MRDDRSRNAPVSDADPWGCAAYPNASMAAVIRQPTHRAECIRDCDLGRVVRPDESHLDGVSHKGQEICEVSIHVQDSARLLMDGEFAPCDRLHEFLERTKAPGQHN